MVESFSSFGIPESGQRQPGRLRQNVWLQWLLSSIQFLINGGQAELRQTHWEQCGVA